MNRLASFVLCVSICGCPHAPPSTSVSIAAPVVTSTVEAPAASATSAPHLEVHTEGLYESWTSSWEGLPAISRDGRSVAYAYQLDDGGRGFPSLYLGVLAIGSEREETTTIFTAEDVAKSVPALPSLVQQRVAQANVRLRGWSPMETFVAEQRVPDDETQRASVGGLEWTFHEPKLVVARDGREVFARALDVGPASDDHCVYAGRLRVASVDAHRRILLVGLRYSAPPDWCPDTDVFRAFAY